MNKKKILLIVKIIVIAVFLIVVLFFARRYFIIFRGYQEFGDEECNPSQYDLRHWGFGGHMASYDKCKICKKKIYSASTTSDIICEECQEITGRCGKCGVLNPKYK